VADAVLPQQHLEGRLPAPGGVLPALVREQLLGSALTPRCLARLWLLGLWSTPLGRPMEAGERVPGPVFEQRRLAPTGHGLDSWQRPYVQAARFGRRTRTVAEPRDELTSAPNVVRGSPKGGPPQQDSQQPFDSRPLQWVRPSSLHLHPVAVRHGPERDHRERGAQRLPRPSRVGRKGSGEVVEVRSDPPSSGQ